MANINSAVTGLGIFKHLRKDFPRSELNAGWEAMRDTLTAGLDLREAISIEILNSANGQSDGPLVGALLFLLHALEETEKATGKTLHEIFRSESFANCGATTYKALKTPGKARHAVMASIPIEESLDAIVLMCAMVVAIRDQLGGINFVHQTTRKIEMQAKPVRKKEASNSHGLRHGRIIKN